MRQVPRSSSDSDFVELNRLSSNIDWRAKKPVFDEQMSYFCMNEEMADVQFVFNRNNKITKIPAHAFALAVASEVFQKELAYSSDNIRIKEGSNVLLVIEVKDERVEIDAFKSTLHFIYNAYKNLELTGDSALAVLYIAMKYMIKPLESHCIDYLLGNFNAENIFTILQFCIDCQTDARLMDECKQFIQSKTEAVLNADSFPKISHKCLELLLKQKVLTVEELCLFKSVLHWAKMACERSGENPNDGKNLRAKLGTTLSLVRFTVLSIKEFAEFVGASGILTLEEQRDVMYMIGGANPIGPLISAITKPRSKNGYVASMDVLKQTSSIKQKLSLLIRIDNFPLFVSSKAEYHSRCIVVNKIRWYIYMDLRQRFNTGDGTINLCITPESPGQPDTLGAYLCGDASLCKNCAFDVVGKFKFKHAPTVVEREFKHKFDINKSNSFHDFNGFSDLAKINDLLDVRNGYLNDNGLELLVDITISESENE